MKVVQVNGARWAVQRRWGHWVATRQNARCLASIRAASLKDLRSEMHVLSCRAGAV
jgi:hypothetical protein